MGLGVRGNNMALLTEEQIQDLYLQLDNVSSKSAMQKVIQEWNEKQTTQQFEPDWSKAPGDATSAVLSLTWVTKGSWAFGYNIAEYERPAPVITPHPHAEIMMKYAEVAARRVDPWVEFEVRCEVKGWTRCGGFNGFHSDFEYRHIGDDK